MTKILADERTPWFNVHSAFDEIEWSPEAYRVYGHLCRRAGQNGTAFPSYKSIGKICFRQAINTGKLTEASARRKAIRAIQELIDLGLLKKEHRSTDGQNGTNIYRLTHTSEWRITQKTQAEVARQGGDLMSLGGDVTSLGGDLTSLGVVTPHHQGGDLTSPKGIPIEGIPIEEKIKSSQDSTCAGAPSGESDLQPKEKNTPALRQDPEFDKFWLWYKNELCPAARNENTSNRVAAHGSKGAAQRSWANLRKNDFFGYGLERFWLANSEYKKQAIASGGIGVPHAERYLRGKKEGSPPWRDVLEDMGTAEAAEDPKTRIGKELTRLGANGVLPIEWQRKTGLAFVSDLDNEQAKQYAAFLMQQVAGEYQHAC